MFRGKCGFCGNYPQKGGTMRKRHRRAIVPAQAIRRHADADVDGPPKAPRHLGIRLGYRKLETVEFSGKLERKHQEKVLEISMLLWPVSVFGMISLIIKIIEIYIKTCNLI